MAARELNGATKAGLLQMPGIPVLLYHGIGHSSNRARFSDESRYWVSADRFRLQLDIIRKLGLRIAMLDELLGDSVEISVPAVAITFDDGLASNHTAALRVLQEAGAVAHFFINTKNVGKSGYMDWTQIRELHCAGMQIGSHGHQHVDHSQSAVAALVPQMTRSRQIIEKELQHPIKWFSAPYGLVSHDLFSAAKLSGFSGLCTSTCSVARPGCFRVPRIAIYGHTSTEEFSKLLSRNPWSYLTRKVNAAGKYLPKQFMLRFNPRALGVNAFQEEI